MSEVASSTEDLPLWLHVLRTDDRIAWGRMSVDRIIQVCGCPMEDHGPREAFERGREDGRAGVDPRLDTPAYATGYRIGQGEA